MSTTATVTLTEQQLELLDRLSDDWGQPREQVLAALAEAALHPGERLAGQR